MTENFSSSNVTANTFCRSLDSVTEYVSQMCLDLLNKLDNGVLNEKMRLSLATLNRGLNGVKLDDKTIRTLACLYHQTEDLELLKSKLPNFMQETLERANNKLTCLTNVPYEISSNSELILLWNLCHGNGCSMDLALKYFGTKSATLINILESKKIITKSILIEKTWITTTDLISNRLDLINNYSVMGKIAESCLKASEDDLVIQFTGEMSSEDMQVCKAELKEVFFKYVRKSAFRTNIPVEIKFNFQLSLVDLNNFTNGVQ